MNGHCGKEKKKTIVWNEFKNIKNYNSCKKCKKKVTVEGKNLKQSALHIVCIINICQNQIHMLTVSPIFVENIDFVNK